MPLAVKLKGLLTYILQKEAVVLRVAKGGLHALHHKLPIPLVGEAHQETHMLACWQLCSTAKCNTVLSVQHQNATQYCQFNIKMHHNTVGSTSKCTTILSVQHQNATQYCRFNTKMHHNTVGSTSKCNTILSVQHQNATQYY